MNEVGGRRRLTITADNYRMNRELLTEDLARVKADVREYERLIKLNETVKP